MYLSRFQRLSPPCRMPQRECLRWLAEAHARNAPDMASDTFLKLLNRYGCGSDKIGWRSSFLKDVTHQEWSSMQIFGRETGVEERVNFYAETLQEPLDGLYSEDKCDFANWIHVTCTGYRSPSVVQNIVSRRGWGSAVQVLHAYHMGCYAALPAIRMARGNLDCEILHTELCSLHMAANNHTPEQLVIQSLFSDGVIRYRVSDQPPAKGYEVDDIREVITPLSLNHMTWAVANKGFSMTLARDVPKCIRESIGALLRPWCTPRTVYAIHPGGPRIIDAVKEALNLSEEQILFSRKILYEHGNMSSATLPHVWQLMLDQIAEGTPVVSVAFGPGLTIAMSKMRKTGC